MLKYLLALKLLVRLEKKNLLIGKEEIKLNEESKMAQREYF